MKKPNTGGGKLRCPRCGQEAPRLDRVVVDERGETLCPTCVELQTTLLSDESDE